MSVYPSAPAGLAPMDVIFCWGVSPFFGWGTVGLNWMLSWPGAALCALPEMRGILASGDPRMGALNERIGQSAKFQNDLLTQRSLSVKADHAVFVAMGNGLLHPIVSHGKSLTGSPTVACPVFEEETGVRANIEKLRHYDLVVAASAWNRDILVDAGIKDARLCHQGVDLAIFNPAVHRPRNDGRFRVFSGGKCEPRKGQDLVIQAFARFAERHDDAVLVCAWSSPWGGLAMEFADTPVGAPPGADIGLPNFRAWLQQNGIKPHQIEIVPRTPNCAMPEIYGGCDVGLFVSRAEGGTNLMAMECMACGVPTIVSCTTGHEDLPSAMWCDAETDDVESALDSAYGATEKLLPDMAGWDWPERLAEMAAIVGGRDA